MSYSITQLKADLSGVLHGTTTNQITGLDNLINRAARQVLMDVDPMETVRTQTLTNPIYDKVYDYALPADVKGNRIIDIYPQGGRTTSDDFSQRNNKDFDLEKITNGFNEFTIIYNTSQKSIRINDNSLPPGILLDDANDASSWTATSTASNLRDNSVNYISGNSAISFDLAAGGSPSNGYIEKTLTTPIDMTEHYNQSSIFFWMYFPVAADITSVTIRWGSSSSNYYSRVLTTSSTGAALQNGWNLFQADWNGSTTTGSPDYTAIDYLYIKVIYDGTATTAVGLENIISNLGTLMNIEYYSKYMFRSSGGTFQETVSDDSDLVNLDTETYNLLFNKVGQLAVQQQQGMDAAYYDGNFFAENYANCLARYKALYKNQVISPSVTYYKGNKGGYSKYLGLK